MCAEKSPKKRVNRLMTAQILRSVVKHGVSIQPILNLNRIS